MMSVANARAYRLGRLPFTLSGGGESVRYLHSELAALREPQSGAPAIEGAASLLPAPRIAFDFVSALPRLTGYADTRPVYVQEDAFRVVFKGLEYHVSVLADGATPSATSPASLSRSAGNTTSVARPLHVAVRHAPRVRRDRLSVALQRARDPSFLSLDERHARAFMYDVFDYLTHVAQLQLGQSYIHASSVERDGEGAAFIGWGGAGKTSALLELVTEYGFRFLSDDLGLVDDSSTIWRTPKLIQLHAFNVEGEERLRSMLFRGRFSLDRATWMLRLWRHGPTGVRRRVAAEELFGAESVARSAPLRRVYYLERVDIGDFEVQEISTAELFRRAAMAVMGVMGHFSYLSHAIHSGHHAPLLPTHVRVMEETISVLARAFRGIPAFNVRVPLAAPASALSACLMRLIR